MWCLPIVIAVYFFLGGLLSAALLTDKNANTNRTEAVFCLIAGPLWPLAIGIAFGFALFENVQEKMHTKRRAREQAVYQFGTKLYKMRLISRDTLSDLQKRLAK